MSQSGYCSSSMLSSRLPGEQETIYLSNEELVPDAILRSWSPPQHSPLCSFLYKVLPWGFPLTTNNGSIKQSHCACDSPFGICWQIRVIKYLLFIYYAFSTVGLQNNLYRIISCPWGGVYSPLREWKPPYMELQIRRYGL